MDLMLNTFESGLEMHPKLIWYGYCKNLVHPHRVLFKLKGQMFMALDPSVFVDDFPARLNGLMSDLRNLEPVSFHIPYPIPHSDIANVISQTLKSIY